MTSRGTSHLPDENDPEHSIDETQSCSDDGQHDDLPRAVHEEVEDSPGIMLMQSVSEILVQSAQSVKALVTGNATPEPSVENENKTLVQSVGERIAQSAFVKEVVASTNTENENGEEKTILQVVGEKIVQSAKTVKDAVKGDVHIIPGDDETAEISILVHTVLD